MQFKNIVMHLTLITRSKGLARLGDRLCIQERGINCEIIAVINVELEE